MIFHLPNQPKTKAMAPLSNPYRSFIKKELLCLQGRIFCIAVSFVVYFCSVWIMNAASNHRAKISPLHAPKGFSVRPKYSSYTKVPPANRRTYYVDEYGLYPYPAIRAFNKLGWKRQIDPTQAQIVWDKMITQYDPEKLKPWQRFNHFPGWQYWDSKMGFAKGFDAYARKHPNKNLYFLPETYLVSTSQGLQKFKKRMYQQGGMNLPWVFKQSHSSNSEGVKMAGPNSPELRNAVQSLESRNFFQDEYIAQAYICNELKWWGNRKIDLRFYWMVASLDPLIVLTHVGFVRVGGQQYDERDFSGNGGKHLTTHRQPGGDERKASVEELERLIREHYYENDYLRLRKTISIDPVQHVRNQIRECIAETVAAFKDVSLRPLSSTEWNTKAENGFTIYGADFVIDNDLDVWYTESQAGPAFPEEFDHQVTLYQEMFQSAYEIVDEIQMKIQDSPQENLLPLRKQAQWDLVYAEDGSGRWMYHYDTYKRRQDKDGCGETTSSSSQNHNFNARRRMR